MPDLGDMAVLKNYQSYPNLHEPFFEDWISWKLFFKSQFFFPNPETFEKTWKNFLKKTFCENFLWKKDFIRQDFWKLFFGKRRLRKLFNVSWYMTIFDQLQMPINQRYITLMKHLITINDITYQDLSPGI